MYYTSQALLIVYGSEIDISLFIISKLVDALDKASLDSRIKKIKATCNLLGSNVIN